MHMKNLIMLLAKVCSKPSLLHTSLWGTIICVTFSGCTEATAIEEGRAAAGFAMSDNMMSRIELDTVKVQPIMNQLQLNGKIAADENRMVEVYPIVGGNVLSVSVELGDYVKKGQTLAVIRSSEVAELERQLFDAQSDVQLGQKKLKVQQDLFNSKLTSEVELEAAGRELEKAQAALKRIKETFSIYHFEKGSEYHVKAPINGFVIYKNINRDMTLPSERTEHVFTVAELSEVWVMAHVYESETSRVSEGMEAEITTLSYPNEALKGKVDKIFNVIDPQTKTMRVRIKLANPDFKLKPEMLAVIKLRSTEATSMPAVPAHALIFDHSKQYVMVYKNRHNLETREVEIFRTNSGKAWVKSGLQPGEVIISKNQLYIYDAFNE
jgi:cobalt-zinc-cadmium efflux system membrane fusion protein